MYSPSCALERSGKVRTALFSFSGLFPPVHRYDVQLRKQLAEQTRVKGLLSFGVSDGVMVTFSGPSLMYGYIMNETTDTVITIYENEFFTITCNCTCMYC